MTGPLLQSGKIWLPALALAGLTFAAGPTLAEDAWETQELTIMAPYRMEHRQTGKTESGMPIETVSINQGVDYSDLDLTKPSSVAELRHRIEIAAQQNCRAIDHFYPQMALNPSVEPDTRSCIQKAVGSTTKQVNYVVQASRQY